MKKQKSHLALKITATLVASAVIAVGIGAVTIRFFTTAKYFRVTDVVSIQEKGVTLSHLVGRNIFSIDLREQAHLLTERYPIYKQVRLVRVLPNRIFVDFLRRRPLGLIRLYKLYSVDEDCVLFDVPQEAAGIDLPLIVGLETKIFGPKAGKKFAVRELELALSIIKEAQANRLLRSWKMRRIDCSLPANAAFYLEVPIRLPSDGQAQRTSKLALLAKADLLEVKIGADTIRTKMGILSDLLIQLKNDWLTIKYMDLRFKEPVIKFKDTNVKK